MACDYGQPGVNNVSIIKDLHFDSDQRVLWIGSAYASWNHLIPERFIALTVFVSTFFALPAGCCFLPFLVMAQLHDTGWRIVTYGALTLVNGIAWAYLIDYAWSRLSRRPEAHGFDVQIRKTNKPSDK